MSEWPRGDGEMAGRIRAHDWAATPLGPVAQWPAALRNTLELMLAHGFPMVLLWGPARIALYNDPYRALLGTHHPEALGQSLYDVWPEVREPVETEVQRALAGEQVNFTGLHLQHLGHRLNDEAWYDATYCALRDEHGQAYAVLATAFETTGRMQVEQELRASEQRYRTLFESIDDGFCVLEVLFDAAGHPADYRFLQINPAFERQTGLFDAVGKTMRELAPLHEQHWFDIYGHIAMTGEPKRFEDAAAALNRWYEVYAFRVGAPEQRRVAVLFRDILTRRRAELALRESEARYRSLFESIDEGVTLIDLEYDADGRCVDFVYGESNPAQERLTGLPELQGKRFTQIAPNVQDGWLEQYASIARTGVPVRFERFAPHLDRWFDVYASRVGGEGSRQVVVVYNNITERKRHEANLAFLAEVSEDLAALTSIGATMDTLGAKLGAHFRVSRCAFAEIDEEAGRALVEFDWHQPHMPSLKGTYHIGDFFNAEFVGTLRAGRIFVMDDRASDPRADPAQLAAVQVAAMIAVPFIRDGRLLFALCIYSDRARQWSEGEATLLQELALRIWTRLERARAERALHDSEQRQRVLIEGMPQLVWRAAVDGQWTWASPQWSHYTGQPETDSHGWGWLAAVHPEDRAAVRAAWAQAGDSGKVELDCRICHAHTHSYRWFHTRASAVRDETNTIIEWLGTSTDVDEARVQQEQQAVLVSELQHRTRNLMGVIRSITTKTGRASADLPDFLGRFGDRLEALARVQGLLSRLHDHDRVTFDELIHTELSAMAGHADRASLEGPKGVRLRSSTVQILALAVHELATNAVKYGALGQAGARLHVAWSLEPQGVGDQPWLHIDWRESGVAMPPADPAPPRGQGRELIERALPYQLDARTTYTLGPDGVHCVISLPVSASTVALN